MMKFSSIPATLLAVLCFTGMVSCGQGSDKNVNSAAQGDFTVQITDKPLTFVNPLNVVVGSERARRGGEPVVLIYQDDYYLFVTGSRGYWFSDNFRDWTYVDAPTFPGGVVSVIVKDDIMYACSMNSFDFYKCANPKSGVWEKAGTFDSNRYGDANMYLDDDGRLYMYSGWSQVMPFKVVELDPNTFKEIGEPVVLFFGDHQNHGFEHKTTEDLIFNYFDHRDYFPEEYPWIEGPWITKYNGKYYLQYAANGLEFLSYGHGIYVSDSPTGPFEYSQHNPLTFKTTGYVNGAGHGSTFFDKNGQLWTICMSPAWYGGRGGQEIVLFPSAIDKDGVMYSNTAFGDYPTYYPGVVPDAVNNGFAGWMLLSNKKKVEVSSTFERNRAGNASDENFMTAWCAETGNPGEYMTMDLGKESDIYALQLNFDRFGATVAVGRGAAAAASLDRYQCYTVEVSSDNRTWRMLIDRSNNNQDLRHDYFELPEAVKARYVKVTNVFTHDEGKFAIKDLRVFGNPSQAKFTVVKDVKIVRNPEDRRSVSLLWSPVAGADGYVVRYGIEPGKLYNNYMVYDANILTINSLNTQPEYYFEVEAFDSGTDYYREPIAQTRGRGAEIELAQGSSGRGGVMVERKMTYEGVNEYVFEGITPGVYTFRHTFGPVLWNGELTAAQLIGSGSQPTLEVNNLTELGRGTQITGSMSLKVLPGADSGKIVITYNYN